MSEQAEQDGVKTPEEIHAEQVEREGVSAAEVEAREESGPQPVRTVAVELPTGVTVGVPMQSTWRRSAVAYLDAYDFDAWAESVLSEADLAEWDEWMNLDPELGEIRDFFEAVGKATGVAADGNRASRRQSMRRRNR